MDATDGPAPANANAMADSAAEDNSNLCTSEHDTKLTCDVLCSLGTVTCTSNTINSAAGTTEKETTSITCTESNMPCTKGGKSPALAACPMVKQLPLFLTKTYHMIDRCEPGIACWSLDGSNFVVKNVEKFASAVLPLYFKHSNFSSFARQLNFYGFRKLRTDPILTSDVDPRTACYVRFYHEKFQKDRPELLHQIKRATKSDQQSKDDVESLKGEVSKLRRAMDKLRDDTDRRLAEMSYECNRRITGLGAEYDKLVALVQQLIQVSGVATALPPTTTSPLVGVPTALRHNPAAAAIAAAAAVAAGVQPTIPASAPPPVTVAPPPLGAHQAPPAPATHGAPDLMQSLSQAAAISLQQQQQQRQQQQQTAGPANGTYTGSTAKRPAEAEAEGAPPAKQTQPDQSQNQE